MCREASILGHESDGVVTLAGLRAWSKLVRAEARGGSGEGILGWNRRAISAYTWCVTEKGPQRRWLHKIGKAGTPACDCRDAVKEEEEEEAQEEQSGEHLVEGCRLLAEASGLVEKEEMREWRTRHARDKKKRKGDVGMEKEKEKEEGEKLASFFGAVYEFFSPVPVIPDGAGLT